MTIFEILKKEHQHVDALLKQAKTTGDDQPGKRKALLETLEAEFSAHATSEEKAVYIPLKLKKETHNFIMKSYEEHDLVEHFFEELDVLSVKDESWSAKIEVLAKIIDQHVKEEEDLLFTQMKELCDSEELIQMAHDFSVYKKTQLNRHKNNKSAPTTLHI